jgi:pimeloyl-ACP methyl ester carboxylesterase
MKFLSCMGLFLVTTLLTGCIDLAVNNGKNKHKDVWKISQVKGEVYTMRGGLGGIFSKGMNHLEDNLENDYHIYASSTVWFKGSDLTHYIIRHYRSQKVHGPIILVGHSLGANEQIQVAKNLAHAHIPVALLITVDAVIPDIIPANVEHAYNIYKPSFIPLFSGLTLRARVPQRTKVDNVNITKIAGANANHFTIDSNRVVQKLMLQQILLTLREPRFLTHHDKR